MAPPSLVFTWQLSWSFAPGSHSTRPTTTNDRRRTLPCDRKEKKLSTAAQNLQRKIRQRALNNYQPPRKPEQPHRQRERLIDAKSLEALESATAAIELAKQKDRESLAILLHHTNEQAMSKKTNPPKTPEHRILRYEDFLNAAPLPDAAPFSTPSEVKKAIVNSRGRIKGLHGTPRSFEPSWSTTSSERREHSSSDNEFEEFITRSVGRGSSSAGKSNSFSALLRSARSSPAEDGGARMEMSEKAKSVIELMQAAEERDAEGGGEGEIDGIYEIEEEWWVEEDPFDKSPTSRIKHLPPATDDPAGRKKTGGIVQSIRAKSERDEQIPSSSDGESDDETTWEVVGAEWQESQ